MSFQVYYPTISLPRSRRPRMFVDDCYDPFVFNPFYDNRNMLSVLDIIANELLRPSSHQQQIKPEQNKPSQSEQHRDDDDQQLAINVDMSGFEPANIRIKTIGQQLIVEGNQEEEESNQQGIQSYSRKHFHRSIKLPDNVKPEDVTSKLTKNGVLRISAPVLSLPAAKQETREIEITRDDQNETQQSGSSSSKTLESDETKSEEPTTSNDAHHDDNKNDQTN